jgi:hypothetical protein
MLCNYHITRPEMIYNFRLGVYLRRSDQPVVVENRCREDITKIHIFITRNLLFANETFVKICGKGLKSA